MGHQQEKVNELLREKLAQIIAAEIPLENGLITITNVDCSPDMRYATIKISVLPEKVSLSALRKVRHTNSLFSKVLRQETRLRQIPKFNWVLDVTERRAAIIEDLINQIKEEGQ